jgi:hypothetical protein
LTDSRWYLVVVSKNVFSLIIIQTKIFMWNNK